MSNPLARRHPLWARFRSWAAWLADREIWPLAVGVALATFTVRWAHWGLGLLAATWLVRWLGRGRLTTRTPLDWPAGLLLIAVPAALYVTTDRQVTFVALGRLLAGLALAYGLVNWGRSKAHVSLLALGMAGVSLGLSLFTPVSIVWGSGTRLSFVPLPLYERTPTLVSDTVNANMMAGALVVALPFCVAPWLLSAPGALPSVIGAAPPIVAWVLDGRWFRRVWFAAATLLTLAALVLTTSRGGWIAGGVALFVLLVRRWRGLLWLIPVVLLGLGVFVWQGGLPALLDALGSGGSLAGWEGRIEIWSRAIYAVQDFPYTGIGAGTFQTVVDVLYPFFLIGPDARIPHAHNLLLQVAVDLGIPGLVAYLSILLLALWSAFDGARAYRREGNEALSAVAWAGLASLVGMLAHGIVDATTWTVGRGAFVPWAVIGVVVALRLHTVGE